MAQRHNSDPDEALDGNARILALSLSRAPQIPTPPIWVPFAHTATYIALVEIFANLVDVEDRAFNQHRVKPNLSMNVHDHTC